jgi:bifunctional phosphoglucose/phosphomannose isomerase
MSGGVKDQIGRLPDQLLESPRTEGGTLPPRGRLLIGGVGGSAAAGDILSILLSPERETLTVREGSLPGHLRRDDSIVLLSYSGETEETLQLLREAGEKGLPRAVVASGGSLLANAARGGLPRASVPAGSAPRGALGFLRRGAAALVPVSREPDWSEGARHLRTLRSGWVDATPGPARILVDELKNRFPVILCGDVVSAFAARRWAADFAENAKIPAVVWELPEAAHNRVMAAAREAPKPFPLALIALGTPREAQARRRWDATLAVLSGHGASVFRVDSPHPEPWIHAVGLTAIGDWVSLLVGEGLGVNLESLSLMNELKARLAAGQESPPR